MAGGGDGAVGFGHAMLRATPESQLEQQPLMDRHAGLVLTADARLDNRGDLMATLGCKSGGEITDSALILKAHAKWGTRCPEYLVGAFAFAIWDAQQAMVFGARDHMGIKPFIYYVRSGRTFAFGSEIKALLAVPDVPRRLNELRVGYHLVAVNEDNAITFYQDIVRLPPGHTITVRREAVRVQSYWTLDPEYELRLESDAAYAEAFAEHFHEAVQSRLRHNGPIGCALSGGLDSSAVASVAATLLNDTSHDRLHTFSGIYDDVPACDERAYVKAVHAEGRYQPHWLRFDQLSPLGDFDRVFWHEDEPHPTPTMYFLWGLYRAAQGAGIRVLLDGVDGDTTVCHGYASLAELAGNRQWVAFVSEAQAVARHEHLPSESVTYWRYGVPALQDLVRRGHWLSLVRAARQLTVLNGRSWPQLVWNDVLKPVAPESLRRVWRTCQGAFVPRTSEPP